jgi:hypothetical protein
LVNAVDLFGDRQGIRGLGMGGGVADLVDVRLGFEVLDANVGDILLRSDAANIRE